ncbi:MAG TPA: hypothetical protein ENN39_01790 [Desulfonatronum sp.]|nr:hypothetical protein [Desulfonatronum sp.]
MYRRALMIIAAVLLVFACGGGGGGSSGTPPTIHEVGVFRNTSPDSQVSTLDVGREYYVAVHASDPDLDMRTLRVEQYHAGASSPMYVDTLRLPSQQYSNTLFWDVIYITGPAGEWRTSFQITDAAGNTSNVYWLHTTARRSKDAGLKSNELDEALDAPLFRLHEADIAVSADPGQFFTNE